MVGIIFIATILCGAALGLMAVHWEDDDGIVLGFYICTLTVLSAPVLDMAMAGRAVFAYITGGDW